MVELGAFEDAPTGRALLRRAEPDRAADGRGRVRANHARPCRPATSPRRPRRSWSPAKPNPSGLTHAADWPRDRREPRRAADRAGARLPAEPPRELAVRRAEVRRRRRRSMRCAPSFACAATPAARRSSCGATYSERVPHPALVGRRRPGDARSRCPDIGDLKKIKPSVAFELPPAIANLLQGDMTKLPTARARRTGSTSPGCAASRSRSSRSAPSSCSTSSCRCST